jgi:hypothetical protein
MRATATMLAACLTLSACVSTSEVVPMGKDSYMLNATSRGGLYAGDEAIAAAKSANEFCNKLGKHMIVRRTGTEGVAGLGPVTATFIFSCVSESDPEYTRPDLQKDPSVIIQDNRVKPQSP